MSRMKTIGFSLKPIHTKPQRLLSSLRIAGGYFLISALLLNSLMIAGCVPNPPTRTRINTFVRKQIEMENIRFETYQLSPGIPTIQPAHTYWLKRGDKLVPRWDTLEWHWEDQAAMTTCNFQNNSSTTFCQICDFCNLTSTANGPPCFGYSEPPIVGNLRILADGSFMASEFPVVIFDYTDSGALLRTCSNNQNPLVFEPYMGGLYRFFDSNFSYKFVGGTNGEAKVHLASSGDIRTAAYQLTRRTVDNVTYWTWAIEGDAIWMENFSPNLRVSDVIIYRNKCADGSAQGKRCLVPDEKVPVKPSRLFFLPNFQNTVSGHLQESSHRCYSDLSLTSTINYVNLLSCHPTYNTNQATEKYATPTYEYFPENPTEKLTWLVEFNTSEGADADLTTTGVLESMPMDAELIIQFTIIRAN